MCYQTAAFPPEPEDADHRDPIEPDGARALGLPGQSSEWLGVVVRGDRGLWLPFPAWPRLVSRGGKAGAFSIGAV